MVNWAHRRSRKQFRREGQPLAPNTDEAGKNVYAFRRFLQEKKPPVQYLEGSVTRRDGYFDPSKEWIFPDTFRRILFAPPVPPQEIKGSYARRNARPPEWVYSTQEWRGLYRVADDSLSLYEAYVGEDAEPTYVTADVDSATLPMDIPLTPPLVGETDFRIVVRKRNEYDLASFNTWSRSIFIDSNGDEVVDDPTSPEDVALTLGESNTVYVSGVYRAANDTYPADYWRIYATGDGTDPLLSTPVDVLMVRTIPSAYIYYQTGTYNYGSIVRVVLQVLRSSDGATDGNTTEFTIQVPHRLERPGYHSAAIGIDM